LTTAKLIKDPLTVGLKRADENGRRLFSYFVTRLNKELEKRELGPIWWQPDSSQNYLNRWYWMFSYNSVARDFITRLNFVSKDVITVQISHFGAKKPVEAEFVPEQLFKRLVYPQKAPPEIRIETKSDVDFYAPLIAEHYLRIAEHIKIGGKLKTRGWSHLEVALKGFINTHDKAEWVGWYHPDFLGGRREIDIANLGEKIAIEVQGTHWHKREGMEDKDIAKKEEILGAGWKLIWAWEDAIKDRFGFSSVLDAIEDVRDCESFVEISQ